ncbi:hypothetical protein BGZ59_000328 [Podila verticillata]|nr:hypothetical protein BGZ59_000328 [Podila verticillata]
MEQRTTARFHPYGGRRNRRHHNNNHEQQPELQGFSGIISNILKKSLSWLFPEQLPERDYSDGDEEASDAEFTIMDFTSSDHTSRTTSSLDTPSSRTPLHRDSVSGSSRDDLGKDTHQQEDQDMNEFQEERSYQLRNYLQHEMTRLKQVSQHSHSYSNKSQKVGRKHHLQNGIPGLTQPDNRLEQTSSDITPPKAVKAHFHSQHQETRPTESAHENLAQTVFVQEAQEKAPDMLAFETDKRRRSSTQSMSTSDDDKPKKKLRSIPGRFSALDSDEEEEDLKRLEREKPHPSAERDPMGCLITTPSETYTPGH